MVRRHVTVLVARRARGWSSPTPTTTPTRRARAATSSRPRPRPCRCTRCASVMLTHVVGPPEQLPAGLARSGAHADPRLGSGQPARPRCPPPAATPTATPTTATGHASPPTTSPCGSAPPPRVSDALADALDFARVLSAASAAPSAAGSTAAPTPPVSDLPCAEGLPPRLRRGSSAAVLPAVAASLGGAGMPGATPSPSPEARRAVVVLVDGLGHELLRRRGGHAPFLRSLLPAAARLDCGFPSTTATSMGTLRHRSAPRRARAGRATRCWCPARTGCSTSSSWEDGPDPVAWQPARDRLRAVAGRRGRRHPGRPGLLRRLGADPGRAARRPVPALPATSATGSTRRWRRCGPAAARSSTSTGASSTRSVTCTAASPGSGATSSRPSTPGCATARPAGARRHRGPRHRRPRHGRRPARAADRPRPRRRAGRRHPAPRG